MFAGISERHVRVGVGFSQVWSTAFESVRREESVRFIREALSRTHGCDGICRSAEDF